VWGVTPLVHAGQGYKSKDRRNAGGWAERKVRDPLDVPRSSHSHRRSSRWIHAFSLPALNILNSPKKARLRPGPATHRPQSPCGGQHGRTGEPARQARSVRKGGSDNTD
jgi:hypothetical protein